MCIFLRRDWDQRLQRNPPLPSFDFLKLLVFVNAITCTENFCIRIQNQLPIVPMSLPFCNQFVIDTGLPKPTNQNLANVALLPNPFVEH